MVSDDDIARAKSYDLRELIGRSLGDPDMSTRAYSKWGCPFHSERTPGAFTVYRTFYKCFSCGANGDQIAWCMNYMNMTFAEAVEFLNNGRSLSQIVADTQRIERDLTAKIEQAQKALDELRTARTWLQYHEQMNRESRDLWNRRGIPDFFIDMWKLGYNPSMHVAHKAKDGWHDYSLPSLSIPVWGSGWEVLNVKHRLIDPPDGVGKYINEKRDVPAAVMMCNPDISSAPRCLAIEGEIKSMVSFIEIGSDSLQVAGLPSSNPSQEQVDQLANYEHITLCLDPDAFIRNESGRAPIESVIGKIGAERVSILRLPAKIDDLILRGSLNRFALARLMRHARSGTSFHL